MARTPFQVPGNAYETQSFPIRMIGGMATATEPMVLATLRFCVLIASTIRVGAGARAVDAVDADAYCRKMASNARAMIGSANGLRNLRGRSVGEKAVASKDDASLVGSSELSSAAWHSYAATTQHRSVL
jgi:hypothetical protein